jgi:hypothetical protein
MVDVPATWGAHNCDRRLRHHPLQLELEFCYICFLIRSLGLQLPRLFTSLKELIIGDECHSLFEASRNAFVLQNFCFKTDTWRASPLKFSCVHFGILLG